MVWFLSQILPLLHPPIKPFDKGRECNARQGKGRGRKEGGGKKNTAEKIALRALPKFAERGGKGDA